MLDFLYGTGLKNIVLKAGVNTLLLVVLLSYLKGINVHKNQIPRFFGRGLTLEDVSTEKDLMPKLNQSC